MTRRAGLDRAAVIEEAVKMIDEEGLEQLALGRLAERLGVRVPSLYNHIAGLPGLRRDLAVYCLRELLGDLTRSVMGKARAEAIFALAHAFRDYARRVPGRYALTLQAPAPDDQEWQELGRQSVGVAIAVLAPYGLGEETTIHAIRSLRSIVQGFISLEMAGGFAIAIEPDVTFDWLVRLYVDGLERMVSDAQIGS
ncbi:MAG TPA: WHG domain-containing protein [Ktedonobacteraceae bacterium]|nr:WHG domain-containing protein [Ktedonobacteraceae bacterium]